MRFFWSLYLRLAGWSVRGTFPHHLKKCIVLVGPHTSSWDFILGLALRSHLRLQHAKYLGKAELFKWPFGAFFRKMGGIPVYRSEKNNMVDQVVDRMNQQENFLLVLSPEGTRKKVDRLRTGFYHIAQRTHTPLLLAGFDFEKKHAILSEPFFTTGDEHADYDCIHRFFANIKGKNPEQGMMHLTKDVS